MDRIVPINTLRFVRCPTPHRVVGDQIVVARPNDGVPVVLNPTVAAVWVLVDQWVDLADLEESFGEQCPSIQPEERIRVLSEALELLEREVLVERAKS